MDTISRREFLNHFIGGTGRIAQLPELARWLPGLVISAPQQSQKADILISIFLRGAMDGLNCVIPYGESAYYSNRPTISIPQPKSGDDHSVIDLDGFFGLHPALKDLVSIWKAGSLAFIHASGSTDPTHSHFDAQDFMERGTPGQKQITSGWINRYLQSTGSSDTSPFRAVSIGTMLPLSMQGSIPAAAIPSLSSFALGGTRSANPVVKNIAQILASEYQGVSALDEAAQLTFKAVQDLAKINPGQYVPKTGAVYPDNNFSQGLKQVAQLVKSEIGLEAATLDLGGFDTHIQEGGADGQLATLFASFASSLSAFYQDLSEQFNRITLIAMSEFGRRVQENGNHGTDHGHGNVMMVISNNLQKAGVFGNWPGLKPDQLYGPGDLAVTTDFRQVLTEVIQNRLQNKKIADIFPGFTPQTPLNLFKG